jgi:hypothetical protein
MKNLSTNKTKAVSPNDRAWAWFKAHGGRMLERSLVEMYQAASEKPATFARNVPTAMMMMMFWNEKAGGQVYRGYCIIQ